MASRSASTIKNGVIFLILILAAMAGGVFLSNLMQPSADQETVESRPRPAASHEDTSTIQRAEQPATASQESLASQRPAPAVDSRFESPFVAVAERLKHSVVNVTVERETGSVGDFHSFEDFFFPPDRGGRPRTVTSGGSGVIIDARGHVITNNHVVENARSITVTLSGGEEREATLVGTDPETDVALLDIGAVEPDWAASLGNSDAIRIGDWAIAMGNPLGLDWTLTVGVISAKGRSDLSIAGGGPVFQDFIQTDASINFGNSGGPLANIRGEVIGINSAVNTAAQGIGFAIPINMAKDVVADLLETGYVQRGYLGMLPVELDPLKKEALGLDESVSGIFVESVSGDTPAEAGGLKASDVIVAVDGAPVKDVTQFRLRVARHKPGDSMTLGVLRDGKKKELTFTLADRNEYVSTASEGVSAGAHAWMGLRVAPLTSPRARQMDIDVDEGVLVLDVDPDSPAAGKLQAGDLIVKVDGKSVATLSDWQQVTGPLLDVRRAVLVMYYRDGKGSSRFVALKR